MHVGVIQVHRQCRYILSIAHQLQGLVHLSVSGEKLCIFPITPKIFYFASLIRRYGSGSSSVIAYSHISTCHILVLASATFSIVGLMSTKVEFWRKTSEIPRKCYRKTPWKSQIIQAKLAVHLVNTRGHRQCHYILSVAHRLQGLVHLSVSGEKSCIFSITLKIFYFASLIRRYGCGSASVIVS